MPKKDVMKKVSKKASKSVPKTEVVHEALSVVVGTGDIVHPDNKNDELLLRNTDLDVLEKIDDLVELTTELDKVVKTFHSGVIRIGKKFNVEIKDFVSFEIHQDGD